MRGRIALPRLNPGEAQETGAEDGDAHEGARSPAAGQGQGGAEGEGEKTDIHESNESN